jgi:hypothetical protein
LWYSGSAGVTTSSLGITSSKELAGIYTELILDAISAYNSNKLGLTKPEYNRAIYSSALAPELLDLASVGHGLELINAGVAVARTLRLYGGDGYHGEGYQSFSGLFYGTDITSRLSSTSALTGGSGDLNERLLEAAGKIFEIEPTPLSMAIRDAILQENKDCSQRNAHKLAIALLQDPLAALVLDAIYEQRPKPEIRQVTGLILPPISVMELSAAM